MIYTSGTTGPPKGVTLPEAALHANLDAVYEAWAWTAGDRVVHALPLYHVHGLLLGTLGPLWRGGSSHHVGRFDPHALGEALRRGGTMVFGVPTMWSRIAAACEADPGWRRRFARRGCSCPARPGCPLSQHARLGELFGRRVIERYGMSETLFTVGERAGTTAAPGSVGTPAAGRRAARSPARRTASARSSCARRGCSPATSGRSRRHARRSRTTASSGPATSRCAVTTACCGSSVAAPPT